MNLGYRDNMLQMLRLLEHRQCMSVPQLVAQHPAHVTERTVQRYLRELRLVYGLNLSGPRRGELALPAQGYHAALARFLKDYFMARRYPPIHGEPSEKQITAALQDHSQPASLICEVMRAIIQSRRLSFVYKPQHPDTRRKVAARQELRGASIVAKGHFAVSMVPRGFSFGGELMLVVGETIFSDGRREYRQYAIRGMLNPVCGQAENTQLEFQFSELYADSIYTWLGGRRYELTVEDARFDEPARIYTLNANGEEEALQFAAASLGRLKIIDPPAEFLLKAKELGLDPAQLFRFRG
jgi:hypothetical protein